MKTTSSNTVKSEAELYDSLSALSIEKIESERIIAYRLRQISTKPVMMAIYTAIIVAIWGGIDYSYDIFVGIPTLLTCAILIGTAPVIYHFGLRKTVQEVHDECRNTISACDRLIEDRRPR